MKVRNSLRSLKQRHRDCRVVRRKGRVYVINKTQRRFKARQGGEGARNHKFGPPEAVPAVRYFHGLRDIRIPILADASRSVACRI